MALEAVYWMAQYNFGRQRVVDSLSSNRERASSELGVLFTNVGRTYDTTSEAIETSSFRAYISIRGRIQCFCL